MLLIASLAATAAIPAYFSRSEVTLDNAARLLVDDLRQAQIRAIYRSAPVEVRFEPDGDGYTVVDRGADPAPPGDPNSVNRRYSHDAVFEGVCVSALQIGTGDSLIFEPDGTTRPGGSITLGYHGEARTVLIEPLHGTVRAPELEMSVLRRRP